jgi:D-alanine transfer protein
VPIAVTALAIIGYNKYLDDHIDSEYNSALGRACDVSEKNKGIKLLQHSAARNDLILMGSSELSNGNYIDENPSHMFPNTELNSDVCLVGFAGIQDLINAIKTGSLSKEFKGKKIVMLVSLQWFLGYYIDDSAYRAHFSELQFYKFMNNKDISDDVKKHVCERTFELTKGDTTFDTPRLYSYLYSKNDFISTLTLDLLKPYYLVHEKFLELKDKHEAYKAVRKFKDCPAQETKKIDWDAEELKAHQTGEKECTNNNLYINNYHYTAYVKPCLDSLKDMYANADLCSSEEMGDYKAALEVFKQNDIKPYIVFVSTNGYYYDYTGLTQEKRANFYDKLEDMAKEYGIDYLDLREHEYEPYFFSDVMHLGWKGWLYVNREIIKYFS